jgi:hypothetical protein
MGGDWHVVRGLGLLILTVLVLGGLGMAAIVAWEYPTLQVSFPFITGAAIAMILLWMVAALAIFIKTRRARTR